MYTEVDKHHGKVMMSMMNGISRRRNPPSLMIVMRAYGSRRFDISMALDEPGVVSYAVVRQSDYYDSFRCVQCY